MAELMSSELGVGTVRLNGRDSVERWAAETPHTHGPFNAGQERGRKA